MEKDEQRQSVNNSSEISFFEIFSKIKSILKHIAGKWIIIVIAMVCGALFGLGYSILKKPQYTAVCSFVLEDSKSGGMGQYASLAALAGLNIGGSGGGIFEGDNILELYKSRLMIEKTLLTECTFNGKNGFLIDRFIESYNLRNKWKKEDELQNIAFKGNPDKFNRTQDSIITDLTDLFNRKLLNVTKPDKKLSIIRVEFTCKDELFSKYFTEKLVENVNEFYVQTKTKKTNQNVQSLQHQADSVKQILNSSINGVANAIDAAPNANPQMSALRVTSQKRQVDVQANIAIYGEMVKNLEIEKLNFRHQVPLIQVIDKPVLPLFISRTTKLNGMLTGAFSAALLLAIIIAFRKIFNSNS